jgi:hypothetical protein
MLNQLVIIITSNLKREKLTVSKSCRQRDSSELITLRCLAEDAFALSIKNIALVAVQLNSDLSLRS